MNAPEVLLSAFRRAFGSDPAVLVRAPGRVNLIGEHTDYNDGYVLPAAIDRAVYLAAAPCPSRLVTLYALDLRESASFRVDETADKNDAAGKPLPAWARYPAGVAWALQQRGLATAGVDVVITSTVPMGAGLSSSAAIETAFAALWQALGGWRLDLMPLAQACRQAEVEYVGINSGLMDQFAALHGRADHALFFDCRTLAWAAIPLPAETAIVAADTKVQRTLAGSEYNVRYAQCREAVRLLQEALPGITALRDVSSADLARHAGLLPEMLRRRAQHVVSECERVLQSAARLKAGDASAFGQAMSESHRSLRDMYEVSCPELDVMVETACALDGCYGARLTGAGFGGCAVALVAAEAAPDFERDLAQRYERATGIRPDVYVCRASAGAEVILGSPFNSENAPPG